MSAAEGVLARGWADGSTFIESTVEEDSPSPRWQRAVVLTLAEYERLKRGSVPKRTCDHMVDPRDKFCAECWRTA